MLMIPLIGNAVLSAIYGIILLVALFGGVYQHDAERGYGILGCFLILAWCGGLVWLYVLAYGSLLALRRECLEAKLKAKS
jgi:hypothetical protein